MTDKKISELNSMSGASLANADKFVVVDTSQDATYHITASNLKTGLDITASGIKTLYESNSNTNAYTDAEKTKLGDIDQDLSTSSSPEFVSLALEGGVITNISGDLALGEGQSGIKFENTGGVRISPVDISTLSLSDDSIDIGGPTNRFEDLYLSGGVYLGGTSTTNKLDYYEEGTWTPSLSFGGSSSGISYAQRAGSYTRIGNVVYVTLEMTLSSNGSSSGGADISLPFTVGDSLSTTVIQGGSSVAYYSGFSGEHYGLSVTPTEGTNELRLRQRDSNTDSLNSSSDESQISDSFSCRISTFYFVD